MIALKNEHSIPKSETMQQISPNNRSNTELRVNEVTHHLKSLIGTKIKNCLKVIFGFEENPNMQLY